MVDCDAHPRCDFRRRGNGGPIHPAVGLVRDSFVGMALLLDAMAECELPIGSMADALPRYEIVKTKIGAGQGKDTRRFGGAGITLRRRDGRPHGWIASRLARPLAAWSAAAIQSRSFGPLPKRLRLPRRGGFAMRHNPC